jgi:hypothetical protein
MFCQPKAAEGDEGPDGFDETERPGALKKPINRTEYAGHSEPKDEPPAAALKRVTHQHCPNGEQSE